MDKKLASLVEEVVFDLARDIDKRKFNLPHSLKF